MAKPEPSGTKAGWCLSLSLNKCGKNRNKCQLFLVVVFLAYRKKKNREIKKCFLQLNCATNMRKTSYPKEQD